MLVYANNFQLQGADSATATYRAIVGWLNYVTKRHFSISEILSGSEFREGVYTVQTFSANKREPHIYSILLRHRDAEVSGRLWLTELSIRENSSDSVFISIMLQTDEASTQVQIIPEATRPKLIDYLANNISSARNAEFSADMVGLSLRNARHETEFKFLQMEIDKPERDYPLVLMSAGDGIYTANPEFLQQQLFGLAQLIRIDESADTWGLANIIGKPYSVWNGSVRIIWPKAQGKDYCYTRLLPKEELLESQRPERVILSLITHRTNLIKKRYHFSPADVRAKRQKDYLLDLRENSAVEGKNDKERADEYKALFEAACEESEEMRAQIEQLKLDKDAAENDSLNYMQEKEDAEKRLKDKEYQIESMVSKTQPEKKLTDITEAVMILAGERRLTPKLCLQLAAQKTGNLIILDSALKSAEAAADYQNSDNLLAALLKLGDEFLSAYMEGGDNRTNAIFTRDTYAPKESSQTMKNPSCIKQRSFSYKGKEITMWQHLGWGVAGNTREGLRLYFYVDQEDKKIVIGHCGAHLDTVKTASL